MNEGPAQLLLVEHSEYALYAIHHELQTLRDQLGQRVSAEGHIVCGHCRNCRAGRRHRGPCRCPGGGSRGHRGGTGRCAGRCCTRCR